MKNEWYKNIKEGIKTTLEVIKQNPGKTLLSFFLMGCEGTSIWDKSLESWDEYNGNIADYSVEISETSYNNGSRIRMVHLDATDEKTIPHAVTGHDFNIDESWERIFIREEPRNGYNAVHFKSNGKQLWRPCPAEKGIVKKFTPEQIKQARYLLSDALTEVRKEGNKIDKIRYYAEKDSIREAQK